MTDVFVSYSRRDSQFVRQLADSVSARGKEVWVDVEGIADGEVFPDAIKHAIEQADSFLFVITPASAASAYCTKEVDYARELKKRIVPVLRDPVPDGALPADIRDRNWIPFTQADEFGASMGRLVAALDTDLEAVKAHTRWLLKALEWDGEGRDRSFLLRGSELKAAEAWLASRPQSAEPAPTQLQREYLLASREAAARRQRMLVGASLAVALVSTGLLVFALISRSQAVSERISAQSAAYSAQSYSELPDDPYISMVLGMRAVREKVTPQSLFALRAALDASPLLRAFPTLPTAAGDCASGFVAALSPSGAQLAEGTCQGQLRLVDVATGRLAHLEQLGSQVSALTYSPNGTLLAVGTNARIVLVNPRSGAIVGARDALELPRGATVPSGPVPVPVPAIKSLAFSRDGRELAANDARGIALWSVPGLRMRQLADDPQEGGGLVFTADGHELVAGDATDNAFDVFAVPGGHLVRRVIMGASEGAVGPDLLALSPDGSELAVSDTVDLSDGGVSIYNARTWALDFGLMSLDNVGIDAVSFSPDGTRIAIGGADGTSGVWSLASHEQLTSYDGPTAAVGAMDFTDGGRAVLTASDDGIVRLWRAVGVEQAFIPIDANIDSVAVTSRRLAVVANASGKVWLYGFRMPGGQPLGRVLVGPVSTTGGVLSADARIGVTFTAPNRTTGVPVPGPVRIVSVATRRAIRTLPPAAVFQAALSPDGSRLFLRVQPPGAASNRIGQAEVVTIATGRTVMLQTAPATRCGSFPAQLSFSGNDARLAGGEFCGLAYVWNTTTGRLVRRIDQDGQISSVSLSPDGSRLLIGSWDSEATIWSVATGRRVVELIGNTRGLNDASFADGGALVVTTALDDSARVWNARTGGELRELDFGNFQGTLAVSPDGGTFAVGQSAWMPGVEDIVRVFQTCPACQDANALMKLATPHVTNYVTTLERTVLAGS